MGQLLKRIQDFLNKPYPECRGVLSYLRASLLIALFIGGFLFIFEPFGLWEAGKQKAWYCFMFGVITFVVSFGADLLMRYPLKLHRDDESWVFWKWMVSVMFTLVAIATANYLFMWSQERATLSFGAFSTMLTATLLVGVFPVFFSGLMNSRRIERSNKRLAQEIRHNFDSTKPMLPGGTSQVDFEIDPSKLLYVEAMQNYVVVHYRENDLNQQKIIRSTLSGIEEKLQGTSIERTHRSFLINKNRIAGVSGNAQGLKLRVQGVDDKYIPVSRKYLAQFR